jgi:hypothetical protein
MILHRSSFRFHGRSHGRSYGHSRFSGLQIVPQSLVPIARATFASQGINGAAVSDTGEVDPQALIALAFDKMEIRTAYTPTIVMDLKAPPDPETAILLNDVKPHITLWGRAGKVEIAPYGMEIPEPAGQWTNATKLVIGAVAGVIGLGLIAKAVL